MEVSIHLLIPWQRSEEQTLCAVGSEAAQGPVLLCARVHLSGALCPGARCSHRPGARALCWQLLIPKMPRPAG